MNWPRIHVDYEICKSLRENYLKALLYHEVIHSILHGSLLNYIINIAKIDLGSLGINLLEATYLVSVVIKDLEVHGYLAKRGLIACLSICVILKIWIAFKYPVYIKIWWSHQA